MGKRVWLASRCFPLITAAFMIGLPLLVLAAPVHATPASTFAELYFRHEGYAVPPDEAGAYLVDYGTNFASLSYTSARGSIGRFTADATAGTLRGFADAVNGAIGVAPGDEVWARGHVLDYFTLHGPTPGAPVSITASFTLDGTLSGAASSPGTAEAYENAFIGTNFISGPNNDPFALWARTGAEMSDCWHHGCPGFSIPIHRETLFALDIIEGTPFALYYGLEARGGWAMGGSGGTADFGGTGAISFALPEGTSITSSGGFSQTNSIPETSPVPAPSALLLLGSGLAGGALLRKRIKAS